MAGAEATRAAALATAERDFLESTGFFFQEKKQLQVADSCASSPVKRRASWEQAAVLIREARHLHRQLRQGSAAPELAASGRLATQAQALESELALQTAALKDLQERLEALPASPGSRKLQGSPQKQPLKRQSRAPTGKLQAQVPKQRPQISSKGLWGRPPTIADIASRAKPACSSRKGPATASSSNPLTLAQDLGENVLSVASASPVPDRARSFVVYQPSIQAAGPRSPTNFT